MNDIYDNFGNHHIGRYNKEHRYIKIKTPQPYYSKYVCSELFKETILFFGEKQ